MNLTEAQHVFRSKGWLSRQDTAFQDEFLSGGELLEVPDGETISAQGDQPGGIFGLANGFIATLTSYGNADPLLAHVFHSGWWFGEAALISETPRRGELIARTDCTLVYVPGYHVETMLRASPAHWRTLARNTVIHFDNLIAIIAGNGTGTALQKVAAALTRLADPEGLATGLPITQAEIAEICGLSRATAGALLIKLQEIGVIETSYRSIWIRDVEALQEIRDSGAV